MSDKNDGWCGFEYEISQMNINLSTFEDNISLIEDYLEDLNEEESSKLEIKLDEIKEILETLNYKVSELAAIDIKEVE